MDNYNRLPSYQDSSLEDDIATHARLLSSLEDDQYNSSGYHSRSASQLSNDTGSYSPRPSTPHRSYNPNQGYELPPPATHSPSPSPTRRRMRDYLPFSPSRMGRGDSRPSTAYTNETREDWQRPPPTPLQYDQESEFSEDRYTPRPETRSSVSASSLASSRRPLPPAPLFNTKKPILKTRHSKFSEDIPILSPTSTIDEEESIFNDRASTDSASTKIEPSLYGTEYPATEYLDEKPVEEQVTNKGENYGPAPQGPVSRRGLNRQAIMTKKMVKLTGGELILECKIPTILYSFLPRRDDQEFTHMRYSAVTCDPDDFASRGFTLRQALPQFRRETELFICITMYNEDEICFTRTMHGVMRNIAHFCSRNKSRVWGKDGWQKIVVCIVADGRKKTHPRVLDALAAMGVYQSGIAKNMVNGKQVNAHVYEYTTQVSLDSDLKFKGAEKGIVPVQMIFCLKEKNAKKLNSHRWAFNAFGSVLNPNICILLDVGTKPGNDSLYHLWKAFDTDSNVGGACGEIKAMKGKGWMGLFNPLVASQNFEYKMSNILDKPLESVFGYITVLPGALSAYRFHALQNNSDGHGPLSQYFKGEELQGKDADIFTANMYLAEDRILCWELVAKRHERWVLKYVRAAHGETDVPDAVPEFVSQRRRWLNGALFAALYSLIHFRQVWYTDHTVVRKILLHIEFVYQFVNLFFTYFSLANFYITFYFISGSLTDDKLDPFGHGWGARIFMVLKIATVLLICTQFILSMGNRPQGAKRMFMWSMILSSLIMAYNTFCALYITISTLAGKNNSALSKIEIGDNVFTNLVVSTASTMGAYMLMSLLYLDPWHMFTSAFQYFMMLPSYIITLQVYAFCNTHDVSWGTKGDNVINTDLGIAVVNKGDMAEVEMPSEQLDIDSGYDEALRNLRDRLEVPQEPISETQVNEDYYRAVRTYMVVIWMMANAILVMAITEIYDVKHVGSNFYLRFLLWAVAAISVFRAIGSTSYLVIQMIHTVMEGKVKLKYDWKDRFQPSWKRQLKKSQGTGSGM